MKKKTVRKPSSGKPHLPLPFLVLGLLIIGFITGSILQSRWTVQAPEVTKTIQSNGKEIFIQTALSGTFVPVNREMGVYSLTLINVASYVSQVTDEPRRAAGSINLDALLNERWTNRTGVLTIHDANQGNEEAVLLELAKPTYDRDLGTLVYKVRILGGGDAVALYAITDKDVSRFPESFDNPVLFIDNSPVVGGQ